MISSLIVFTLLPLVLRILCVISLSPAVRLFRIESWTWDGQRSELDMGRPTIRAGHGTANDHSWTWDGQRSQLDMGRPTIRAGHGTANDQCWTWDGQRSELDMGRPTIRAQELYEVEVAVLGSPVPNSP